MKSKTNIVLLLVLISLLLVGFQNCSQARFTPTAELNTSLSTTKYSNEVLFEVTKSQNANVDILFVIDNSGSMKEEQAKIAQVFSGFIAQVSHMNWRIAITTTDTSSADVACNKGNLCVMESAPSTRYFIDSSTPNVNQVFIEKIQVGTTGSGTELGLTALSSKWLALFA
ncbi:MAG: hypothetical protein H7235_03525 [Bdellovibrionaceae bacterium]|nr:hypothetical protein [Pseudobdellovibrionaceae bacterium]